MALGQRAARVDEEFHLALRSVDGVRPSTQNLLLLLRWLQNLSEDVLLALESHSWELDIKEADMEGVVDLRPFGDLAKVVRVKGQCASCHHLVAGQGLQHYGRHFESEVPLISFVVSAKLDFRKYD